MSAKKPGGKKDPFSLPKNYNISRTPAAYPVMPVEVYYNKLTQEDEEPKKP